jgi:hypothetical protein
MAVNDLGRPVSPQITIDPRLDEAVQASNAQPRTAGVVVVVKVGNVEEIITVVKDADLGQSVGHRLFGMTFGMAIFGGEGT